MSDARRPRHEASDGDSSSSNWKDLYAALDADPDRPTRRRRRAAEDEQPEAVPPVDDSPPVDATPPVDSATQVDDTPPADSTNQVDDARPADVDSSPAVTEYVPRRLRHSEPEESAAKGASSPSDPDAATEYRARRWRPDPDELEQPTTAEVSASEAEIEDPEASAVESESEEAAASKSTTPWPAELTGPEFGEPDTTTPTPYGFAEQLSATKPESTGSASTDAVSTDPGAGDSDADELPTLTEITPEPLEASAPPHDEARGNDHVYSTAPIPATTEADQPTWVAAGTEDEEPERPRSRHAAEKSAAKLPVWLIIIAAVVAVALLVWLVIGLTGDSDDTTAGQETTATTSASPTALNVGDIAPVLCTGQTYAFIDTGLSGEQMLADPGSLDEQYPDAQLASVPGGCILGSTAVDEIVLALGPFNSVEEACAAGREITGVTVTVYAGSAEAGLTETACP